MTSLLTTTTTTTVTVTADNYKATLTEAATLASQGNHTDAIEKYNAVLLAFPQFDEETSFHCALGSSYFSLGNKQLALTHFCTAGTLDPTNAAATINAGILSKEVGKLDDAIKWFQTTLTTTPDNLQALLPLAVAYINIATCTPKATADSHTRNMRSHIFQTAKSCMVWCSVVREVWCG